MITIESIEDIHTLALNYKDALVEEQVFNAYANSNSLYIVEEGEKGAFRTRHKFGEGLTYGMRCYFCEKLNRSLFPQRTVLKEAEIIASTSINSF